MRLRALFGRDLKVRNCTELNKEENYTKSEEGFCRETSPGSPSSGEGVILAISIFPNIPNITDDVAPRVPEISFNIKGVCALKLEVLENRNSRQSAKLAGHSEISRAAKRSLMFDICSPIHASCLEGQFT